MYFVLTYHTSIKNKSLLKFKEKIIVIKIFFKIIGRFMKIPQYIKENTSTLMCM